MTCSHYSGRPVSQQVSSRHVGQVAPVTAWRRRALVSIVSQCSEATHLMSRRTVRLWLSHHQLWPTDPRSVAVGTLDQPPSFSLTVISFTYESPHLWNQLPSSFRQPHSVYSPPGSPHPVPITSSQSSSSLSPSITASTFHSRLKTHLFHKSFPA